MDQVPGTWRAVIEEASTLQIFLDLYAASKPPLSSMALECLVRGAGLQLCQPVRLPRVPRERTVSTTASCHPTYDTQIETAVRPSVVLLNSTIVSTQQGCCGRRNKGDEHGE